MSDKIDLLTDRYYPRGGECLPVILIRSPYGRGHQFRDLALIFAERGFQVLLQELPGDRRFRRVVVSVISGGTGRRQYHRLA